MKKEFLFDESIAHQLKVELWQKKGLRIFSKSDCNQLRDQIFKEGLGYLSESTLYRLFLSQKFHKPYFNTLNIIARFLNYPDYLSFYESISIASNLKVRLGLNQYKNSILFFTIENETYKPLSYFFEALHEEQESVKSHSILHLYDVLLYSTKTKSFFKFFARNPFIRKEFFENGFDPLFRIPEYEFGFIQYLKSVKLCQDSIEFESFIFGNCILFRHYFLSNNTIKAHSIGRILFEKDFGIENYINQVHWFPLIRYHAYKLWFKKMTNHYSFSNESAVEKALDFCEKNYSLWNWHECSMALHTFSEVFSHFRLSSFHEMRFKHIFQSLLQKTNPTLLQKPITNLLPYFEPNGLVVHRPA
jgi:hypothetical protein